MLLVKVETGRRRCSGGLGRVTAMLKAKGERETKMCDPGVGRRDQQQGVREPKVESCDKQTESCDEQAEN